MGEIRYTFTASAPTSVLAALRSITTAAQQAEAAVGRVGGGVGGGGVGGGGVGGGGGAAGRHRHGAGDPFAQEIRARARGEERINRARYRAQRQFQVQEAQRQGRRWREEQSQIRKAGSMREAQERKIAQVANRRLASEARTQERMVRSRSRMIARGIGGAAMWGGRAALYGGAMLGAATVGIGGRAIRQAVGLQDVATTIAVKSSGFGQRVNAAQMRRGFEQTALGTPGTKAMDVAEGVGAFVKRTGRADIIVPLQGIMAEIGMATNTPLKDLGEAFATLFQQFDIKDVSQMSRAMSNWAVQGKKGAFELEDMARIAPKVAAAGRVFGMEKGVAGATQLGGLLQIAKQPSGSSQEAATALVNIFSTFEKKADQLEQKYGFKVYEEGPHGVKQARDITDVIVDYIKGSKGDPTALATTFTQRGFKGMSPMVNVFNDARKMGKSLDEAGEEVRKFIQSFTAVTNAENIVRHDSVLMQQRTSARLTAMWETMAAEMGAKAMPAVISALSQFASVFARAGIAQKLGELAEGAGVVAETLFDIARRLHLIGPPDPKRRAEELRKEDEELTRESLSITGPGGLLTRSAEGKRLSPEDRERVGAIRKRRMAIHKALEPTVVAEKEEQKTLGESDPTGKGLLQALITSGVPAHKAASTMKYLEAHPDEAQKTIDDLVGTPSTGMKIGRIAGTVMGAAGGMPGALVGRKLGGIVASGLGGGTELPSNVQAKLDAWTQSYTLSTGKLVTQSDATAEALGTLADAALDAVGFLINIIGGGSPGVNVVR